MKPKDQKDMPLNEEPLGKMDVLEALPLIMEKFGVSEAEAYSMWYEHQKKVPVVDDVMDNDEFERTFPKSKSMIFSFKTGKRLDTETSEDQDNS